uniref:Uncharacterized protein n=1 Tax=Arundo donax TaxID=35708 RepID=A0A0A9EG60_ARUDO
MVRNHSVKKMNLVYLTGNSKGFI